MYVTRYTSARVRKSTRRFATFLPFEILKIVLDGKYVFIYWTPHFSLEGDFMMIQQQCSMPFNVYVCRLRTPFALFLAVTCIIDA